MDKKSKSFNINKSVAEIDIDNIEESSIFDYDDGISDFQHFILCLVECKEEFDKNKAKVLKVKKEIFNLRFGEAKK